MKAFTIVLKILAALAAIAGVIYVAATYGDRIVAWAKKLLGKAEDLCCGDCNCQCEDDCDNCPCTNDCDACPCDASCACGEEPEPAAEEPAATPEDGTVHAEEGDFEG